MEESWGWADQQDPPPPQQQQQHPSSAGDPGAPKGNDGYDAASRFRGEGGNRSYLSQLHEQDPPPPGHSQSQQQGRYDVGQSRSAGGYHSRQDYQFRDRDRGYGGNAPHGQGYRNKPMRGGFEQPPPSHFHNTGPPGRDRGMGGPRHMGGYDDRHHSNPNAAPRFTDRDRERDRGAPRFRDNRDRDQGPGFDRHHGPPHNGPVANGNPNGGRFNSNSTDWNNRPGPPRFQGFNGAGPGTYEQHSGSQFMGNGRQFNSGGRNMGPNHGPPRRDRDFGGPRGGRQGGGFQGGGYNEQWERGVVRRDGGFSGGRDDGPGRFQPPGGPGQGAPGPRFRDDAPRFDRGQPGPGRFDRGPPNPRFQPDVGPGPGPGPGPGRFQPGGGPPVRQRDTRGPSAFGPGSGGGVGPGRGRESEPRKKELPMTTGSAFQQGRPSTNRSNRDREDQFLAQRSSKTEGSTRPNSILFGVEKRAADGKLMGPPEFPDDEDLVRRMCGRLGEIRSVRKFGDNWMIVTFYETRPVDNAFRELNGKPWKGKEGVIRVKSRIKPGSNLGGGGPPKEYNSRGDFSSRGGGSYHSHSEYKRQHRHPIGPTCSIWVAYEVVQKTEDGGHTEALEEAELVEIFSRFGEIHSTKCDGRKLFSFVNFAAVESAEAAFSAFRKGEIDSRERKMKMKWGYPPPNHPLHEEISKLEDERYARNENKFQAVTQPANNLYDRVARAIEADKQNEKERREQEAKKRAEERKKAEEERQKQQAEREVVRPRKKKVVVIGTSAAKIEKSAAAVETKAKELVKEETPAVTSTPTHKADAFACKVIELLNNCAGNWREFISELGRQKLNVRENANHLFDLYICGAIIEGPETVYIPDGVHSDLNVFQADFPDFVQVPTLASAQAAPSDAKLGNWSKVFENSDSLGLEKLNVEESTGSNAGKDVAEEAVKEKVKLGLAEYVDLFVQTRRRLRYTATQLEASLLRYCNLAVALPRPVCDRIAVFIGMLLGSSIGTQGTSGLLFPLANALAEDRLTQDYRAARMFAMIARSFLHEDKSADLAKVLSKGKLNTRDVVSRIMPEGQRTAFKLAEFLTAQDVPLTYILKAESLLRVQKEVATASAKSCYTKVAAAVKSGSVDAASSAVLEAAKQVSGTRTAGAEDSAMEEQMKLSFIAAYAAIIQHCTALDNEALAKHIYSWSKVLKQCEMAPYDHVVEGRERCLLDTIYAICTSDSTPQQELELVVGDQMEEYVKSAPLLTEKLLLLLHPLYDTDEDVLSEDIILKWFEETVKPGSPKVCAQVTNYINWLKEAEEEDDSEDED